jgi:hypothetical protein
MSYPNQRIIKVAKRVGKTKDQTNGFTFINLVSLENANKNLSGNGLKLWLYLVSNKNGFVLELSQKGCELWGLKRSTYYNAFKELMSKSYIVPTDKKNYFAFYDIPHTTDLK